MAEKKKRDQMKTTLTKTQEVMYQREFKRAKRAADEKS
ncbi:MULTISPECIES: YfhE family protein [Bacillus]|uniref:YfhE family protein n=1 Tax=Bacillus glycinifermentans TaxID=1664069 RepID=A0AAJ4D1F1_9BACI|nr:MULTISPECIES: YfhE family protein [Bacillus]MBU8786763.1 YfhE family protein [Bacillus glycinifermentans]MDU0072452.1 YfhE family protein [Bacillus sp. IG6]MED8020245.1 YfhE family protein [Bacillus glycinifermentans]NUJ18244.1 YfhE family protein [Bacillus glycinifermentans]QAT64320.1 YfhE family protein [Bacillus glycinifermentans]